MIGSRIENRGEAQEVLRDPRTRWPTPRDYKTALEQLQFARDFLRVAIVSTMAT